MYNTLVARCFDGCVSNFRSKALDKSEITCVEHCAGRYIKMTQRVGLRFAEHQAMQQKRAESGTGAGAGAGGAATK
jgi:import inner membrane translocase subunit TIM9